MIEDVAGGEAAHSEAARHKVEAAQPNRVAGTAAMGKRAGGAVPESAGQSGERGLGGRVRPVGDQGRDEPFGMSGDILPMEEALPLLALLRHRPALAQG